MRFLSQEGLSNMVTYLYERDLTEMKLIILSSALHEKTVAALCKKYGLRRQILRKKMIRLFDMSLLENIPARYEVWEKTLPEAKESIESRLGVTLLTQQIPLIADDEMSFIVQQTKEKISTGYNEEQAMKEGIAMIREVIHS